MFKFAHKINSYGDESRVDFNLSKRKQNFRFKDKVLYLKDQAILLKDNNYWYKQKYWYKFVYVMNDELMYDYITENHKLKKNNILHREDEPAIIRLNGDKDWYVNGKRHREDEPAIIRSNGDKEWYLNGKKHREDGPATIYSNGYHEYWRNGVQYTP